MHAWTVTFLIVLSMLLPARQTSAQAVVQPITVGDVTIAGSLRTRGYSWRWFGDTANGEYTYPASLFRVGIYEPHDAADWRAEFALPVVMNLPTTAVAAAPQGQLGLGAAYFAANDNRATAAAVFLKQGFLRVKHLGGIPGQSLTVGRFEFNDGSETIPTDVTLAALKRDRISQRLLGTFGFSDVGRSIDGVLYTVTGPQWNVTAVAGRPTQGVFQVNGWPELSINVFYGAVTRQGGRDAHANEWRLFALGYDDRRDGVVKVDSRSLAIRTADTSSITIGTYGGHYLQAVDTRSGPIDLLLWGAIQSGSWGALTHRASAFAVEGGWQPRALDSLKPWLRVGFDYGSGTHDPTGSTHGTFFQVLPTPRVYARFPFFNLMNIQDAFGEVVLRPTKRATLRSDVHALSLADAHDLWYSGGGAFQPTSFGYTGRPSSGYGGLATLSDVSGDYEISGRVSFNAYYGYAAKQLVTQGIYPAGHSAHFGYGELVLRF
jgi:alginate export protein